MGEIIWRLAYYEHSFLKFSWWYVHPFLGWSSVWGAEEHANINRCSVKEVFFFVDCIEVFNTSRYVTNHIVKVVKQRTCLAWKDTIKEGTLWFRKSSWNRSPRGLCFQKGRNRGMNFQCTLQTPFLTPSLRFGYDLF